MLLQCWVNEGGRKRAQNKQAEGHQNGSVRKQRLVPPNTAVDRGRVVVVCVSATVTATATADVRWQCEQNEKRGTQLRDAQNPEDEFEAAKLEYCGR